jgi:hypothetical protein
VRQITITTPEGHASDVTQIAFAVGISEVSVNSTRCINATETATIKDRVEIDTSTDLAKAFIDALMTASFFDADHYSIAVRQPRSIITKQRFAALTMPLVEPATDLFEELGQFCQITYGFAGRIFIGGLLLAVGLHDDRLLYIISGLLFIPVLPLILAVGFSLCTRQWSLCGRALVALAVALVLLLSSGVVVGLTSDGPIRYSESNSVLTGFLISFAVGVAAALASSDDAGRREMIGLAATSQVAVIPAWLGLCLISGFPIFGADKPFQRILSLSINIIAIVVASATTYALLRMKGKPLDAVTR